MKWDIELNDSGENTDIKLINKCCPRNITRNNPESDIVTFLVMDEVNSPIYGLILQILRTKIRLKKVIPKYYELIESNLDLL